MSKSGGNGDRPGRGGLLSGFLGNNVPPTTPTAGPQPRAGSADRTAIVQWLTKSGLFQAEWYLKRYPDVAKSGLDPWDHFDRFGWAEGRLPNPCFDPKWYLEHNADVAKAKTNPLAHYALYGERENRRPIGYLDVKWYRERYRSEIRADGVLAHYLRHRSLNRYWPNAVFDPVYYINANADVASAGIDPLEHFLGPGWREGRNPSAHFDARFYAGRHLKDDPRDILSHFVEVGGPTGLSTRPDPSIPTLAEEVRHWTGKSPYFEDINPRLAGNLTRRAKVLAFYLPQFHAIPENDEWWGEGFTEWTNVARALPRFVGHYQPRIPRDFGHYDLNDPSVMPRQVAAAKDAGLHGFCFYYYNFNGKRLLEKPVDGFLARREIDFPFCLMWANENWTRRWDGFESEVLMSQDYLGEDAEALVDDIARHFADKRYIRIAGRPLFIVYRADTIPDTKETLALWRELFLKRHGENPHILMAQGFGNFDPTVHGFDGAIEFPPHKVTADLQSVNTSCTMLDETATMRILKYDDIVTASLAEAAPAYNMIKTVVPSWDNDARRQGHGMSVLGSTPAKYAEWLDGAIEYARRNPFEGEPLVFVNAWNEWAEGAYLEPDVHFGGAYLNATARAVVGLLSSARRRKVAMVGHDAHAHGAQTLLINIAKVFQRQFGTETRILLREHGPLLPAYREVAPTVIARSGADMSPEARELAADGFSHAILNTVAAGSAVAALKRNGFETVALVHELPRIIEEKGLDPEARALAQKADEIVFAAGAVRDAFVDLVGDVSAKLSVRPQGLYSPVKRVEGARESVRDELGLPATARIVFNVGYGDLRKGVDLFCLAAKLLQATHPDIYFLWAGDLDPSIKIWLAGDRAPDNVRFLGARSDMSRLFSAADVFALTSREDPYPSVVVEALSAGLPVIAFDKAGGFTELLNESGTGKLLPPDDVAALAEEIVRTIDESATTAETRASRATAIKKRFAFDDYAFDLLQRLEPDLKRVSVIVPNYNYARYMLDRLISIFGQTYPLFETIVLDDASTDDSLKKIAEIATSAKRAITVVPNKVNSGNVFAQWAKGVAMARGDLVWIAEADDIADPNFVERLTLHFADPQIAFACSDSRAIDSDGNVTSESYKSYYARQGVGTLAADVVDDAAHFAKRYLSQRNLILNVSSVLWRRERLLRVLQESERDLPDYKLAGDWRLYLGAAALGGKIAYCAKPMNSHRRHDSGVTSRLNAERHIDEVARAQNFFNTRFGEDSVRRKAQSEYLDELKTQFGLNKPAPVR